jgi:hypothetical protein
MQLCLKVQSYWFASFVSGTDLVMSLLLAVLYKADYIEKRPVLKTNIYFHKMTTVLEMKIDNYEDFWNYRYGT